MDLSLSYGRFGRLLLPNLNTIVPFTKLPTVLGGLLSRSISCSTILSKHNQRKPRTIGSGAPKKDKPSSGHSSAKELLATSNRAKWEQENARLISLAGKAPHLDIYLASEFEPRKFLLDEIVQAMQEAGHPDMYDCMDNALHVKAAVNMRTKKRTKFMQKFEFHLVLPHLLHFIPKNRVLALCQDPEQISACLTNGALDAGTADLFSRLEHGNFHSEEYDTLVAHTSWEPTLSKLRHVLKDRMPSRKNGRLGDDVSSLVTIFANGTSIESTAFTGVPEIAHIDLIIGQLCWDINHLESNLRSYLEMIELNRPARAVGDFILSAELQCPPLTEKFALNIEHYMPVIENTKNQTSKEQDDEDQDVLAEHAESSHV